jgi:hypothetical protein
MLNITGDREKVYEERMGAIHNSGGIEHRCKTPPMVSQKSTIPPVYPFPINIRERHLYAMLPINPTQHAKTIRKAALV